MKIATFILSRKVTVGFEKGASEDDARRLLKEWVIENAEILAQSAYTDSPILIADIIAIKKED